MRIQRRHGVGSARLQIQIQPGALGVIDQGIPVRAREWLEIAQNQRRVGIVHRHFELRDLVVGFQSRDEIGQLGNALADRRVQHFATAEFGDVR